MGKSRKIIVPNNTLVIDIHANRFITFIVINKESPKILALTYIDKYTLEQYFLRQRVVRIINDYIDEFDIDTLIYEQNKLFIDKIETNPDPNVYRNIVMGFGIKISIEDNFYSTIKHIIELPDYEWKKKVLNSSVKYSIDLYKAHITSYETFSQAELDVFQTYNFYKVLCLGESIFFDTLMNKKYQINKGE